MKRIYFQGIVVLFIVVFGIGTWVEFRSGKQNEKGQTGFQYSVNFAGQYSPQEKRIPVKKGVVLFEIKEGRFRWVLDGTQVAKLVDPWGAEMYISVTYNGVTKKLAGPKSRLTAPYDGFVIPQVEYDKKSFRPVVDQVWTGQGDSVRFQEEPLIVIVRNMAGDESITGIPELQDLQKSEPVKVKKPELKKASKPSKFLPSVVKRALGTEPELPEHREFWDTAIKIEK